jgi:GNAT superfamily N-acetyltransferase
MTSIHLMSADQSEAIAKLGVLAFTEYGEPRGWNPSPRTQQNILACLNLNPSGCFVATVDEPVGFIFSRRWGEVGWIGTFGVHPDFQGQNIGQSLLDAALRHLEGAGCTTIGLETMPDSPYNVGMYARRGFRLMFPTLLLEKKTSLPAQPVPYMLLSQLPKAEAIPAVTRVSQAAWSGLDYAPEAKNADEYKWGETLLLGWPRPWGFAIVRTVPKLEGLLEPICDASALVAHPEMRHQFPQILQAVESFAHNRNVPQVSLPINALDWPVLQQALEYGFRVQHVMLRMFYKQNRVRPAGIDSSRWAM